MVKIAEIVWIERTEIIVGIHVVVHVVSQVYGRLALGNLVLLRGVGHLSVHLWLESMLSHQGH